MLVESVGASVVVAKVRKGKISNLKDATIEKWYLFVAAFMLEFFSVYMNSKGVHFFLENIMLIHFITYSMLFIALYFNRKSMAFKIITFGIVLNFIVIMANMGRMPVSAEALQKAELVENYQSLKDDKVATHTLIKENTQLKFLADTMALTKPYPRPKVFSIGDIFMALGVFLYIQEIMMVKRKTG